MLKTNAPYTDDTAYLNIYLYLPAKINSACIESAQKWDSLCSELAGNTSTSNSKKYLK